MRFISRPRNYNATTNKQTHLVFSPKATYSAYIFYLAAKTLQLSLRQKNNIIRSVSYLNAFDGKQTHYHRTGSVQGGHYTLDVHVWSISSHIAHIQKIHFAT
jgi:hypothetical protein